jgi:hypothetical protein
MDLLVARLSKGGLSCGTCKVYVGRGKTFIQSVAFILN